MAAYPRIDWGLLRALDASLLPDPGQAAARELRFVRIAQLPWAQKGFLPEWLREALLDSLVPFQREQVRRVYLGSSFGEGITEEEERGLELD